MTDIYSQNQSNNQLVNQTVFVVNLQYLIGWKGIKIDEIEDTNDNNILGIYKNQSDAYQTAIKHNLKLLNDIGIYSGDHLDLIDYNSNYNLFDIYNNLISAIELKKFKNKHTEQYAVVNEFKIN